MAAEETSDLQKKLNLKPGMKIRVIGQPEGVRLDGLDVVDGREDAVITFVRALSDLSSAGAVEVINAAKADRTAWLAYPKGGQLGTDLNRDILWQNLLKHGVQGVRQVSIDSVWSAMRFRPAK
jgi:hypothetical protein